MGPRPEPAPEPAETPDPWVPPTLPEPPQRPNTMGLHKPARAKALLAYHQELDGWSWTCVRIERDYMVRRIQQGASLLMRPGHSPTVHDVSCPHAEAYVERSEAWAQARKQAERHREDLVFLTVPVVPTLFSPAEAPRVLGRRYQLCKDCKPDLPQAVPDPTIGIRAGSLTARHAGVRIILGGEDLGELVSVEQMTLLATTTGIVTVFADTDLRYLKPEDFPVDPVAPMPAHLSEAIDTMVGDFDEAHRADPGRPEAQP